VLILVQQPQHKSTSDPVGAPKNNQFGAIFIEFGDTNKCYTFSGLELVPKSRKKLIGALSCMQKVQNAFKPFRTISKKILLLKSTKNAQYAQYIHLTDKSADFLRKKHFFLIPPRDLHYYWASAQHCVECFCLCGC